MQKPDWAALVALDDGVKLRPGCSADDMTRCEDVLETCMPPALQALYALSNGLWDEPGQWSVVWPLADVVERNRTAWNVEGAQRQKWVGFGDDGTGNPFCFARDGGDAMYYWSPIDQKAARLADDAASFWTAWSARELPPH